MIHFTLSRNGKHASFRVPCSEDQIEAAQKNLDIPYRTDTRVYVDSVNSAIDELKVLEGYEENMDFLNLLGRVMDSMTDLEFEQFRMGLWHEEAATLKDIINISVSLPRYTIINPDNMRESGIQYCMNTQGCISAEESKTKDFSKVAKELLNSGECEDTPYGKLYVNEEEEIADWFDGKHLPPYLDRLSVLTVNLVNGKDKDFIFLPCSDAEILRSAQRLGVTYPDDLKIQIEGEMYNFNEEIASIMDAAVDSTDITTLNNYTRLFQDMSSEEAEKHAAVVDYVRKYFKAPNDLRNLLNIESNIDCFTYAPEVASYRELGRYMICRSGDYNYDAELDDYYNYEKFGEDLCASEMGRFTEAGYVGIVDYQTIRPFLGENSMQMGGM